MLLCADSVAGELLTLKAGANIVEKFEMSKFLMVCVSHARLYAERRRMGCRAGVREGTQDVSVWFW